MWIAPKFGFFSIVQADGCWQVRARPKDDLAEPNAAAKLRDLPFRVTVG